MKTSILEQNEISSGVVELVQRLVDMISWPDRRQAMADVTNTLLNGKTRVAEDVFGWGRTAVSLGMNELQTGIVCVNDLSKRRKPTTEEKYPELVVDIRRIVDFGEPSASEFAHTLLLHEDDGEGRTFRTAEEGMARGKGSRRAYLVQYFEPPKLPTSSCDQNSSPKKTEYTDAIFDNVKLINAAADADPEAIRISVDTKATVNIGPYSRGGLSRGIQAVKAADHDMMLKEKLVPGGILETDNGKAFLFFTASNKTSDFLTDGIELWWKANQKRLSTVKRIVVNMDNGPECSGHRSQFLQRMVEFSDREQVEVRLIYYPPYHSKYNAIERYWGGLERSWNGYLLDSVETVLKRASNFMWRNVQATVTILASIYEKGIKLNAKRKIELEHRLQRSKQLPWWDITICPITVH